MVARRAPGPYGIWLDPHRSAHREPGRSTRDAATSRGRQVPDSPTDKAARHLDGVPVLIVEDSDDSREVLRLALQYCGALVTSVATASEAESLLRELRPHVLATDINMPDDGVALIRAVRAMIAA